MPSSSTAAPATADDVLTVLVQRRLLSSTEAGVALLAAMSEAIRTALLRVRLGPGGAPIPDRGAAVVLPRTVTFERLPPQPSTSAAVNFEDA